MNILIQSGNVRIIQEESGALAAQERQGDQWVYCYRHDGSPVVVPNTAAGLDECESAVGLCIISSLNPGIGE